MLDLDRAQGVASPALLVTSGWKSASPTFSVAIVPIVSAWAALLIVKLRATCVAALYVPSPAWLAVTVQVPAISIVPRVMPPPSVATPQMVGVVVANTTGRPELAVPVMVKGVALQVRLLMLANVIV